MLSPSANYVRSVGVLLHPTALPGSPVCGSFGAPSRRWLEAIAKNEINVWQMLPLAPCDSTGSPYSSPSSFAFNPWFLDVNDLIQEGFLAEDTELQLEKSCENNRLRLDFGLAEIRSKKIGEFLRVFWGNQSEKRKLAFETWCKSQFWLEAHASFMELRSQFNNLPWWEWPEDFANYTSNSMENWRFQNEESLLEHRLLQWHLDRQWQQLRRISSELGVLLFGDLPFYPSRDSADVWSQKALFSILPNGVLTEQSGVPPDYFSDNGQLWGTPVYKWEKHESSGFSWWRKRFNRHLEQFDILRLDHFRALESYWSVPGDQKTAKEGSWVKSPGVNLLNALRMDCEKGLPLVAEDLGIITPEVETLRDDFGFPGMKILQFAFDGNLNNPYLPENITGNSWIVYTGTHDNPTTQGWWNDLDQKTKDQVEKSMKLKNIDELIAWKIIDLGLSSQASLFVAPMQDLLSLGNEARFNKPGTIINNWNWRLSDFKDGVQEALLKYSQRSKSSGRVFSKPSHLLSSLFSI